MTKIITILSVAGSDNSSGAGVQADIKTSMSLNAYCLTALTNITSQNSKYVYKVFSLPSSLVISQINLLLDDYEIDGIKIGLITDITLAKSLVKILTRFNRKIPIVIDPIYSSSTNKKFTNKKQFVQIYESFFYLKAILTPNLIEAKILAKIKNDENISIEYLLKKNSKIYNKQVIITGGDIKSDFSVDYLIIKNKICQFKSQKILSKNTHGSGCSFSTAMTIFLAKGETIFEAIRKSKQFIKKSIKKSPKFGLEYGPIGH
jgi:hydroxymethylpyrimidine/phosphomethylpyrimidine kinase